MLAGGSENAGQVVRIGDTLRRPRGEGHAVVEALLVHLDDVGFEMAPRLLGVDELDRQILDFVEGNVDNRPPWQADDRANADALGDIAAALKSLHQATSSFVAPGDAGPRRSLANPGPVWTHGDVGYGNLVYRGTELIGMIDWEFAAPGHRCNDLAALIAVSVRGPRPDVDDNERRGRAVRTAIDAVAGRYGLSDEERSGLPEMAAKCIDDAVEFWQATGVGESLDNWRWRANWFRTESNL